MKTLLWIFIWVICTVQVNAQIVNIPDANFKNALLNHNPVIDTNGDGEIQVSEAELLTSILVISDKGIQDLTGIEGFINVMKIRCNGNSVTSLDVSQNIALKELHCDNNALTSLDVTQNTMLEELSCQGNSITTLDPSQNQHLKKLYCDDNQLSNLDVSNNFAIELLSCMRNILTTLTIGDKEHLKAIWCSNNQLGLLLNNESVPNLTDLSCELNQLFELEVFSNVLSYLSCSYNNILTIRVHSNVLGYLDASFNSLNPMVYPLPLSPVLHTLNLNSTGIKELDLSQNPNLEYIELGAEIESLNLKNGNNQAINSFNFFHGISQALSCIQVDDPDWSATNWSHIPDYLFYTDCSETIEIPDHNFRTYLISNSRINLNGDFDIQRSEAEHPSANAFYMSGENIHDLSGVEHFSYLQVLIVENNLLQELDLSQNPSLVGLNCSNNLLQSLNVKNGNNINMDFSSVGNPDLTCVEVDDPTYSTTNWTNIDGHTSFSLDCSAIATTFSISGQVNTFSSREILDIEVVLNSSSVFTNQDGHYSFLDVSNGNYVLTPVKTTDSSGINLLDLIRLKRHLDGIELLDSPYKIIAADIDGSGVVDQADYDLLQQYIIGKTTSLVQQWRFVPSNFTFPDPTNPFGSVFPESLSYQPLNSDQSDQDFIGIKIGDLDDSWRP